MMDEKDLPAGNVNPLGFTGKEFENAADYLAKNREALNYQPLTPWNEVKSNPTPQNVLAFMGEAAVTSLPDMAAALLASPAYFASYVSPIAEKRAENDGRTQPTPEDLAVASIAALGISQAERFGAKGVFGQNVGNVAQRLVGAGIKNLELKLFRTHCNTQLKQLVLRRVLNFRSSRPSSSWCSWRF